MKFEIYDYVDTGGTNEFKSWTEGLQKSERGKLREKIDKLRMHGDDLFPHMLTDSGVPGIHKLRVQGKVKLRPLLCKGPIGIDIEYTMLFGAKEIGDKWSPKSAPDIANTKKKEVAADPTSRRIAHEKVS